MKNKRPTQAMRIIKYIEDNGSIDTWESYEYLGIVRLAARILELRKYGYDFNVDGVTKATRDGASKTIARYTLRRASEPQREYKREKTKGARKDKVVDQVEKYMDKYGAITSFEAYRDLDITLLPPFILALKKKRDIKDKWIKFSNKYGKGQYKLYSFREVDNEIEREMSKIKLAQPYNGEKIEESLYEELKGIKKKISKMAEVGELTRMEYNILIYFYMAWREYNTIVVKGDDLFERKECRLREDGEPKAIEILKALKGGPTKFELVKVEEVYNKLKERGLAIWKH